VNKGARLTIALFHRQDDDDSHVNVRDDEKRNDVHSTDRVQVVVLLSGRTEFVEADALVEAGRDRMFFHVINDRLKWFALIKSKTTVTLLFD
jgi:hypothetical protein